MRQLTPTDRHFGCSPAEGSELLGSALESAVRRAAADQPASVMLSGGLDPANVGAAIAHGAMVSLAIGAISVIVADPVISEGRVIVAGASGEMAAFDLMRGDRLWTADVTSTQTPWVAGSFIYIITERNELVCMLQQGGRIRWISPLPTLVDPSNIDSRRIRWVGPILVSDRLLVASSEGELVTLSPQTGEQLGSVAIGGGVSVPPAVADGTVFFLTDDAELVAFR